MPGLSEGEGLSRHQRDYAHWFHQYELRWLLKAHIARCCVARGYDVPRRGLASVERVGAPLFDSSWDGSYGAGMTSSVSSLYAEHPGQRLGRSDVPIRAPHVTAGLNPGGIYRWG